MQDNLTELPEAIPLHRVSPAWRLLAILAIIIALLSLIGAISMSAVIHGLQMQLSNRPVNWTPPPAPAPIVSVPVVNVPPDKPIIDPGNLPYPLQEDLKQTLGFGQPPANAQPTPRERLLRLGKEIWKCPPDWSVSQVAVALDGHYLAFFHGSKLLVGPFNNLREVDEPGRPDSNPRVSPPPPPVRRETPAAARLVGYPAWSADSRYVYFANAAGKLRRFDTQRQELETLPFRGHWPAAWGKDASQFIFVRSQAATKLDAPGTQAAGDLTELVVGNLTTKTARVLVKAGMAQWAYPALDPDGKQIAVWSTRGEETAGPLRYQLLLIDTASGASSPVKGVTTTSPGPITWLPDEPALIYERGIDAPLPPDCLAGESHPVPHRAASLFQYDLTKQSETRLSRGGGFGSPSADAEGNLLYVAWQWQAERERNTARLIKTPLVTVRKFASNAAKLPLRDVAGWSAVIDLVCQDAKVPADLAALALTPDLLARLADAFALHYPKRFGEKPATGPDGFDRQLAEVRDLKLPAEIRPRLLLILAAVHGEFLRSQHGAAWHISEGATPITVDAARVENSFAQAVRFFTFMERAAFADSAPSPNDLLREAAGRKLVLTNNPAAAQVKLAEMIDPDLARGTALLKAGKPTEAEKVLSAMVQREPNQRNHHLALHVARQLYDHKRLAAVETILERIADQPPADPRTFNLLGLALLDRDPRGAINAFKKSLRCDLHHGPAYLNLALAYQRSGDTPSGIACLRRYLELLPSGPLAVDAARRLAELEEDKGVK